MSHFLSSQSCFPSWVPLWLPCQVLYFLIYIIISAIMFDIIVYLIIPKFGWFAKIEKHDLIDKVGFGIQEFEKQFFLIKIVPFEKTFKQYNKAVSRFKKVEVLLPQTNLVLSNAGEVKEILTKIKALIFRFKYSINNYVGWKNQSASQRKLVGYPSAEIVEQSQREWEFMWREDDKSLSGQIHLLIERLVEILNKERNENAKP